MKRKIFFWDFCGALLLTIPLLAADPRGRNDSNMSRGNIGRSVTGGPSGVDRFSHGSVRHSETHVYQRPTQMQPTPQRRFETRPNNRPETRREVASPRVNVHRPDVFVHRDVDVDVHRNHRWNDFVFGRRFHRLPVGIFTLQIGGAPYFYDDGVYYQPFDGGYQEVYPPVGAVIPQPPPGSIPIYAGGQIYYYAGGAFYLQQDDGSFLLAPTPLGVIVPELPPGAVQVVIQGTIAYQFNGIYYQPVFVNGVTQYQTFEP